MGINNDVPISNSAMRKYIQMNQIQSDFLSTSSYKQLTKEERVAIKIHNTRKGFTEERLKKLKLLDKRRARIKWEE